jgi:RimJ/RimL family protein N-acetyltransferase
MPREPIALEDVLAGLLPARRLDRSGQAFLVRLLRPDDRPALLDFYDAFEPKRAAQGLPPTGRDRITRWLDSILNVGAHLIAASEGRLVGHGLLMPTSRDDVYEWAIFLARDHRGRGIGTEVNRLAIEVGRRLGLRKLWLSVEPHNRPAIRSYENAGFRFRSSAIFSPEAEMELEL